MLKKWQCICMMSTLFVCMITVLGFTQTASAQSVVSQQAARPAAFLDCDASAVKPVVYHGTIYARGALSCERRAQIRVQITLYKVVGDDLLLVSSASAKGRRDTLRVSVDSDCQYGRYRSVVIGYAWNVFQQDWTRIAIARSETARASCFFEHR